MGMLSIICIPFQVIGMTWYSNKTVLEKFIFAHVSRSFVSGVKSLGYLINLQNLYFLHFIFRTILTNVS